MIFLPGAPERVTGGGASAGGHCSGRCRWPAARYRPGLVDFRVSPHRIVALGFDIFCLRRSRRPGALPAPHAVGDPVGLGTFSPRRQRFIGAVRQGFDHARRHLRTGRGSARAHRQGAPSASAPVGTAAAAYRRTLVAQPVRGCDRKVGVEALGVVAPPRRGLGPGVRLPDRVLFGAGLRLPATHTGGQPQRVRAAGAAGSRAGRRWAGHLKCTLEPAHLAVKLPVRRLLVTRGRHSGTATTARPASQIGCWCRRQAGAPAPGTPTSPARGRPGRARR
jgi:hypothetical protein